MIGNTQFCLWTEGDLDSGGFALMYKCSFRNTHLLALTLGDLGTLSIDDLFGITYVFTDSVTKERRLSLH